MTNRARVGFATVALAAASLFASAQSIAYEIRQVQIKHLQIGAGKVLYMTINADTTVSGCAVNYGWVRMDLDNANVEGITKEIIAFAMSAYMSGTLVDVGSNTNGCVNGFANLSFIRVGKYD